MTKSNRLTFREIRQVHELIGRIRDFGDQPKIWQRIALNGLLELLGGTIGISVDIRIEPEGVPRFVDPQDTGWPTESVRRRFETYVASGEMAQDPGAMRLIEVQRNAHSVTSTRRELVDDATWYQSPCVSEARRMADVDDFLVCSSVVKPGCSQGFIVYRGWHDHTFEPRQRRLMRYFHLELLRAIRDQRQQPPVHSYFPQLAPRLRQTFDLLLSPLSMKQIAERLGLSRHTVNDYQKEIYRQFEVNTRPELMCLFRPSKRAIRLPAGLE